MKLFLFLLFPSLAICQTPIPKNNEGNYEYTAVVNVDSLPADKLYSNGKIFVVQAFKSGKEVTELNDDESKTIAGSGTKRIYFKGLNAGLEYFIRFKFIIQAKDGRYKYTINDFELTPGSVALENEKALKHYVTKNLKEQMMNQLSEGMLEFIADLKKNMASQSAATTAW